MRQVIDATLIAGFIVLDWLRFHDILKPEVPSAADLLTGLLSVGVFYVAMKSLVEQREVPSPNSPRPS
jgi:hypothetical protein